MVTVGLDVDGCLCRLKCNNQRVRSAAVEQAEIVWRSLLCHQRRRLLVVLVRLGFKHIAHANKSENLRTAASDTL
jgi:hypothetical protein